jgi:hypothetical protein
VIAAVIAAVFLGGAVPAAPVGGVARQPLASQARRVRESLESLGQPLPGEQATRLDEALRLDDAELAVKGIQEALDSLCVAIVEINPESRLKASIGPVAKRLVQHGWTVFLVKVVNQAGITAPLAATSPNARPVVAPSSGSPAPPPGITAAEVANRWADIRMIDERPMTPTLSGLGVEYRLIQIYSRDAGPLARVAPVEVTHHHDLPHHRDEDADREQQQGLPLLLGLEEVRTRRAKVDRHNPILAPGGGV